jgi:chorismate dehydratase
MPATLCSPRTIRLGAVSYLNTLPLIEGLGKLVDVSLTLTAPSRLAGLLAEGEVDLALASVIDAQRAPEPLALLPVGMIGSDGPTLTVRLYSRGPIEQVARVHADIDSHTSIALLKVILAERFGCTPEIVDFDAESAPEDARPRPDSLLLIGDKVVARAPAAELYPHQMDLGEAWRALTGMPFVYAVWMCRAAEADEPHVRAAAAILDRQRRHNATRVDWIAAACAPARGWSSGSAADYLRTHLRFEVTDADRAAVERFFDFCVAHGVLARRHATRWID